MTLAAEIPKGEELLKQGKERKHLLKMAQPQQGPCLLTDCFEKLLSGTLEAKQLFPATPLQSEL